MTAKNGQSKEDLARQIVKEDNLKAGLICVFSTLEDILKKKFGKKKSNSR
jgi:hypothetical protein